MAVTCSDSNVVTLSPHSANKVLTDKWGKPFTHCWYCNLPLVVVCRDNNVVTGSPHPADEVLADKWDKPYSRELAAYPASWTRQAKFWPTTSRVDNVYGDKHLVSRLPEAAAAFAVAVGE